MKIAIVHDYLERWGGAEQVLKALLEIFPEANVFTLIYDKEKIKDFINVKNVNTSFANRMPKFIKKRKRYLLPLMPVFVENFNLRDYDVVISSSSAFAKGIIVRPKTLHICYCHSPMRFVWDWRLEYRKEQKKGRIINAVIGMMANYLRLWDFSSAQRVDYFIANSQNVANRIEKYYRKESKVIYPFAKKLRDLPPSERGIEGVLKPYFLIISQLAPYKRIDLAVEAFNKLDLPLVVAGEGKEKKHLQKIAKSNIKFLGFVPEKQKWQLLENCEALIFPGEEDFGITMVEAMEAGKPILAFKKGGALEIIKEGETGEFFEYPCVECLTEGVKRLREKMKYFDQEKIRKEAQKFSKEKFKENFEKYFKEVLKIHKS